MGVRKMNVLLGLLFQVFKGLIWIVLVTCIEAGVLYILQKIPVLLSTVFRSYHREKI